MRFRFRPVLAVCAAAGVAVLVSLGVWQLERLAWKRDLIARTELRLAAAPITFDEAVARSLAGENMEYAPVVLDGVYAHDLEARVFGSLKGEAGAYVLTPLDVPAPGGGRRFIYVNRGFVPQRLVKSETRAESDVKGEVAVDGLFRAAETPSGFAKLFQPADQPEDNLWFVRDPARLAAHHQIETVPYYVDSSGAENPAPWPKGGTTRLEFPNRHFEYALTWFGLAAALVGVYLAFSLKRG
ncbi:MAG: SURF1 family cytochrome oxidase biogenesis protein [Parvularculaceae bacterium]